MKYSAACTAVVLVAVTLSGCGGGASSTTPSASSTTPMRLRSSTTPGSLPRTSTKATDPSTTPAPLTTSAPTGTPAPVPTPAPLTTSAPIGTPAPVPTPALMNIMDTAKSMGLTTLVNLLNRTHLGHTDLQGLGPFTLFAPTNEALASIDFESMSFAALENLLKYHIVRAQIPRDGLQGHRFLSTRYNNHYLGLEGEWPYRLHSETGNAALVNRSEAERIHGCGQGCGIEASCSNGVIYVVDAVLIPQDGTPTMDIVETIEKAGLTTMVNYLEQANLTSLLQGPGPFTLFASTNSVLLPNNCPGCSDHLQELMPYNIVERSMPTSELTSDETVSTLYKDHYHSHNHTLRLFFDVDTEVPGEAAFLFRVAADQTSDSASHMVTPGIMCTNGVVYIQETLQVPLMPGGLHDAAIQTI